MGSRTGIEWTDSTWNPTTGCTKVSRGCDNCYAATLAERLQRSNYLRRKPAVDSPANREDPFAVRLWPDRLSIPERWIEPRRVFVDSMSDLFHKDIPEVFVRRCFEVMLEVDRHVYQVLTKRPARAARFVRRHQDLFGDKGLPEHIWIGTSVEEQAVDYRIRHLIDVPATIRFLSCEPLIGPLDLERTEFSQGIHWVIVGGESGLHHRPIREKWVRKIRDACLEADVAYFFKQWGGRTPKANGRLLDGRTWDQFPQKPGARYRVT